MFACLFKGERPLDLAHQAKNRVIIHVLSEEEKMRERRTSKFLKILEKNEVPYIQTNLGTPHCPCFETIFALENTVQKHNFEEDKEKVQIIGEMSCICS